MNVHFQNLQPKGFVHKEKKKFFVGSDESLKGDTFGGLCVAAVLVNEEQRQLLMQKGICDSKKLSHHQIFVLAKVIRELTPYWCVESIYPKEYNMYSLTGLLNKYHRVASDSVILACKQDVKEDILVTHVVDKFPGANVGDVLETKAESKYVEVAAASILAREAALLQMEELSKRAGFTLPLGSTHVREGLLRIMQTDHELGEFVKLHFKNVQEVRKSL